MNDAPDDSDSNNDEVQWADEKSSSARHVFGMANAFSKYETMMKIYLVDKEQHKAGSSKRTQILTEEILNKKNKKALRNDPN